MLIQLYITKDVGIKSKMILIIFFLYFLNVFFIMHSAHIIHISNKNSGMFFLNDNSQLGHWPPNLMMSDRQARAAQSTWSSDVRENDPWKDLGDGV